MASDLASLDRLELYGNRLERLVLPGCAGSLRFLGVQNNPLRDLSVPVWMDLDALRLDGFPEEHISFHAGSLKVEGSALSWRWGTLQFAPTVNGPWTDLPVASPFPLSPIGEQGFFRVKVSSAAEAWEENSE